MSHNSKGCFDLHGLVRFHTKTIQKRVKIWQVSYDLGGLVGFHIEAIQKWVKIEKVAWICVVY